MANCKLLALVTELPSQPQPLHINSMIEENGDSALAAIGDAVSGLVTGDALPAPIRRNALKAFDALCSAIRDS